MAKEKVFKYVIGVLVLILSIIWIYNFKIVVIEGDSMNPTFVNGEIIIARKMPCDINKGDVIVFKIDEDIYVKRVIALGGDEVRNDEKSGIVYVNDKEVALYKGEESGTINNYVIPENKYFVVGDNYDVSIDSRSEKIGLIESKDIQAVLLKK